MTSKTIRFEEFQARVGDYWLPNDYDQTLSATIQGIATTWGANRGFIRLVFDEGTSVLTGVDHRLASGGYQPLWATAQDPRAARADAIAATFPTSFDNMWSTGNRWDDFLVYARERRIDENTAFLLAVEAYRQAPGIPAQLQVYETYIAEEAPQQVNIDGDTRTAIEARADGAADVFDQAQTEILALLRDTFSGFLTWLRGRV